MHNWRRYLSSNWSEIDQKRGSKFGALLWRHLTPQNFSNPSAMYTKWCAQTFPPMFWIFAIFDRNLAKIMVPPSTPRTHRAPDSERDKKN